MTAVPLQVVEEARQLDLPVYLAVGHRGAEPPAADEHALVDELLDRPTHGRSRELESLGHGHLVLEGIARLQDAAGDRGAQLLGQLVVERDR